MMRRKGILRAAGIFLALTLIAAGISQVAVAKDKEAEGKQRGPRVDQNTGKKLNEALEQLKADHPDQAEATLGQLNLDRLSPYERSRVEQLYAAIKQTEQKYAGAREHLKKALESGGLNEQEASTVRFQIAQLFMAEEHWKEGVEALKQWFSEEKNPNSSAYHLLAIAYYQMGDLQAALEPAQKAIDLSGGKPQESWLQLLLALRIKREEYKLAIPLVMQLIESNPAKKEYWVQLASVTVSLGNYAIATLPMQLAYNAGLLTQGQEMRRLAELLVQTKVPYRAAQILTKTIEQKQLNADASVYQLLGNCWIAAREFDKAIQPLTKAAELAETGDPYVRLAEVYAQRENWSGAAEAIRHGLDKGKIKNPGNAQLLLGIALYSQKKTQEARTWFQRAREESTSRAQADGWLKQIDNEIRSQTG